MANLVTWLVHARMLLSPPILMIVCVSHAISPATCLVTALKPQYKILNFFLLMWTLATSPCDLLQLRKGRTSCSGLSLPSPCSVFDALTLILSRTTALLTGLCATTATRRDILPEIALSHRLHLRLSCAITAVSLDIVLGTAHSHLLMRLLLPGAGVTTGLHLFVTTANNQVTLPRTALLLLRYVFFLITLVIPEGRCCPCSCWECEVIGNI